MLPLFPASKHLELQDREAIQRYTSPHEPYSDFNFLSMWSYDVNGALEVSELDGNLIVLFQHYLNHCPVYSIFGKGVTAGTVDLVLKRADERGFNAVLNLIPEIALESSWMDSDEYSCEFDEDNFDYVLSVNLLADLPGGQFSTKRYQANHFRKCNHPGTENIDLSSRVVRQSIESLFLEWVDAKRGSMSDAQREFFALCRTIDIADLFELVCLGVYIRDRLVGFTILENSRHGYAVLHFEKANAEFSGIYPFMKREIGLRLRGTGACLINYEQDLGIPGLKESKRRWRPVNYLRKYTVSRRG